MTKTERILTTLTHLLSPKRAKGVSVTYAFKFSGDDGGEYTLSVENGICSLSQGISPAASTLIECSDTTWIAISEGRVKPWRAMFRKEMKISGNRFAMFRFNGLFSGDTVAEDVPGHLHKETVNERNFRKGLQSTSGKVLVIQASPRGKEGATELLLRELVAGLEEGGASVDIEYLAEAEIKPCTGCYTCWKHTEGICIHKDDMSVIQSRIPLYDLMVLAAPLYTDSVPGKLKSFFDRCIPLGHPYIFNKAGRCRHPSRFAKLPNIALLSVCGFYEKENFNVLLKWLEENAENSHMPLVASLLRPHSHILLGNLKFAKIDLVLEATKLAGLELAQTGTVSRKTRAIVSMPIIPRPIFMSGGKNWWKTDY